MKTQNKFSILLILMFLGISVAGFAGQRDETDIRKTKDFDAIKVSTGIDLYLKMGDEQRVKIVAEDDIIDRIVTEVEDGVLKIYMKKTSFFNWGGFNKTRKAYVTVTDLRAIHASSGSDVRGENTLKGDELSIKSSSGSDVNLEVVYKNLSIDASSGSDARISGKTKNLKVEASSGSDIKAGDLASVNCEARGSSGSDITVRVSEKLVARASSGSDIRYYGNPNVKDIDESSGGDIKRK